MKKLFAVVLSAVTVAAVGCNQDSRPGGPGVTSTPGTSTTTANRPTYGEPERAFELSVPTLSTRLAQGETKSVTVGVSRGKNFDEDVALHFDTLPQGITISPTAATIAHGDREVKLTVHAAQDAALGDFTVDVSGHPTKGADAKTKLKLTVVAP